MEVEKFEKILKKLIEAGKNHEMVKIYYPETERKKEGWRVIEPYEISTDVPPKGEVLSVEKDHIRPGHILNAYNVGSGDDKLHSFILGKIKNIERTGNNFKSRNDWEVKF